MAVYVDPLCATEPSEPGQLRSHVARMAQRVFAGARLSTRKEYHNDNP